MKTKRIAVICQSFIEYKKYFHELLNQKINVKYNYKYNFFYIEEDCDLIMVDSVEKVKGNYFSDYVITGDFYKFDWSIVEQVKLRLK